MKRSVQKKKKSKQNQEVKAVLCDIVNKIKAFSETDKKMEELANYCSGKCADLDVRK